MYDTGEYRPLVEICDECCRDPETCGYDPSDCEADAWDRAAEERFMAMWEAYD